MLKILFNPSRLCPGGGAVAQCAMTKNYMLQVSNWSLSRMYKSSPVPTKVIFKQKLPRIHLHSQRQCTWRIIVIFWWTEGKLNWSVRKRNQSEIIKENQETLLVVISFQKFQKKRKDDQEKMFSFNRPYRR